MTTLGHDLATGAPVMLEGDARERHLLILGKTGTGKSNLMLHLLAQDMAAGHGLCLIDPLGQLARAALAHVPAHRANDVVYLDAGDTAHPFGLNIFREDVTAEDVSALFQKVWGGSWGATINRWILAIANTFLAAGEGTILDMPRILTDAAYRRRMTQGVTNYATRLTWQLFGNKDEIPTGDLGSTFNRLVAFLASDTLVHIVGQEETTNPFAEIVAGRKILIINLAEQSPGVGEETAALLGTMCFQILKSHLLRYGRGHSFYLYCDEFQRFATPDLARLLSGGRQFRAGLTLATQTLANVDPGLREQVGSNVGGTVAYTLEYPDALDVARGLSRLPVPKPKQLEPRPVQALLDGRHPTPILGEIARPFFGGLRRQSRGEYTRRPELYDSIVDRCDRYLTARMTGSLSAADEGPKLRAIMAAVQEMDDIAFERAIADAIGDPILQHDLARARREYQTGDRYTDGIDILAFLGKILAKQPLYKQEREAAPTAADIARAITSLEATLGRGTAVAKLLSGEHTIRVPLVAEPPDSWSQPIEATSRQRYTRERAIVEAEIAARFGDAGGTGTGAGDTSPTRRVPKAKRWPE